MRQYPRASLYIFQCQHGKTCNFIADCPECAREEINSLRTKLAAAEKDAERYRHILRQQWHGHISNLSGTRTFEEYVEHINKLRDEAMAKEKE